MPCDGRPGFVVATVHVGDPALVVGALDVDAQRWDSSVRQSKEYERESSRSHR